MANFKPMRGDYAVDQALYTVEANAYDPNGYSLYNMAGNVSEWCLDWYDADFFQFCVDNNYSSNPINNSISDDGELKILKGGSHTYPAPFAMSSHRFDTPPFVTTDHMGFRIVERTGGVGLNEIKTIQSLIKTIDLLGRDATKKGFRFKIYDDGSVDKTYYIK